jgi:hypothetical protein
MGGRALDPQRLQATSGLLRIVQQHVALLLRRREPGQYRVGSETGTDRARTNPVVWAHRAVYTISARAIRSYAGYPTQHGERRMRRWRLPAGQTQALTFGECEPHDKALAFPQLHVVAVYKILRVLNCRFIMRAFEIPRAGEVPVWSDRMEPILGHQSAALGRAPAA